MFSDIINRGTYSNIDAHNNTSNRHIVNAIVSSLYALGRFGINSIREKIIYLLLKIIIFLEQNRILICNLYCLGCNKIRCNVTGASMWSGIWYTLLYYPKPARRWLCQL
jgi:hypothetical protein